MTEDQRDAVIAVAKAMADLDRKDWGVANQPWYMEEAELFINRLANHGFTVALADDGYELK